MMEMNMETVTGIDNIKPAIFVPPKRVIIAVMECSDTVVIDSNQLREYDVRSFKFVGVLSIFDLINEPLSH